MHIINFKHNKSIDCTSSSPPPPTNAHFLLVQTFCTNRGLYKLNKFIKHFLVHGQFDYNLFILILFWNLDLEKLDECTNDKTLAKNNRLPRNTENGRSFYSDKIITVRCAVGIKRADLRVFDEVSNSSSNRIVVVNEYRRLHFKIRTRAHPLGRCEPRDESRWKINKERLNDERDEPR